MLFYIYLIFAIIFATFIWVFVYEFVENKDFGMLSCAFISLIFAITFFISANFLMKKVGTVCSVEKIQTSYTQTVIDGKIELIPAYSYLVLFQTENGEYRTFTTTNVNYGILKEGDSVTYTLDSTEKIKEE